MVFRWGHSHRSSHFRLSGEVQKAKKQRCDKKNGGGAKTKERNNYHSFAFATSHSRHPTFALSPFFSFSGSITYLIEVSYLPEVFRMLPDIIGTHALDSVAVQSCLQ